MRSTLWLLLLLVPTTAYAQANTQLWGNVTLDWLKGTGTTLEVDFEPKVLLSAPPGDPDWHNLDVTPSIEHALRNWVDVTGELATGYTKQTDDDNTFELTTRIGAHFHLFSRALPTIVRERALGELPPARRVVLRDLIRVEQRNLFHSEESTESSWRFRNRLEVLFPLNRARITDDGARYLLSDWEWFVPLGDPHERFANRQRIRVGFGYRRTVRWRFEALYIFTRSRDTTSEPFSTSDNIVNFRVKRVF